MNIDAVVFDLYGVLGLNGWQTFKARHFADRPEGWEHLRRLGQRADAGLTSQAEFVRALALATEESEATVRRQFESTRANVPLLHFIARELKPRYKIGLLSNTSHDVYASIFTADEFALFDVAVGSFAVGLTKPDPKMFQLIAAQLGTVPEACLMVDDKPQHLDAAQKLGMKTVLYTTVGQTITDIRAELAQ
mgnify:CR=1 FL=1